MSKTIGWLTSVVCAYNLTGEQIDFGGPFSSYAQIAMDKLQFDVVVVVSSLLKKAGYDLSYYETDDIDLNELVYLVYLTYTGEGSIAHKLHIANADIRKIVKLQNILEGSRKKLLKKKYFKAVVEVFEILRAWSTDAYALLQKGIADKDPGALLHNTQIFCDVAKNATHQVLVAQHEEIATSRLYKEVEFVSEWD